MAPRTRSGARSGFTLIEVIVVLAVVASLAAILTPMVVRYVEDARDSRARSDVKVIGAAINQFYRDLATGPIKPSSGSTTLEVLVGPGDTPSTTGASGWPTSLDPSENTVGALSDQLISNAPGYSTDDSNARRGQALIWQGPYIETVDSDPWGNRYVVDVQGFTTSTAVFALSAGPNGEVETDAQQDRIGELIVGGDDMVFRIR